MQNWQIGSFELRDNAGQRVMVQVDPDIESDTIRVGSFDTIQRFMNGNGGTTNGNGGTTPSARKRAGSKRSGAVAASRGRAGLGRSTEWGFTDAQKDKIRDAVTGNDPHLTDLEKRVLRERFLNATPPTTAVLAKSLGLKNTSDITLLTRSGLRHLDIRVRKLRRYVGRGSK